MLQDIFNFIKDNFWWIVPLLIAVVQSIILILFKKRPYVDLVGLYEDLVPLILTAEAKFPDSGSGKKKLNFVIEEYLKQHPNFHYDDELRWSIEYLLCIPQKKKGGK